LDIKESFEDLLKGFLPVSNVSFEARKPCGGTTQGLQFPYRLLLPMGTFEAPQCRFERIPAGLACFVSIP
jgi:hypothetical protein